jgi:predicted metal-binding transcription factor (methanogenesis marker protein 9)
MPYKAFKDAMAGCCFKSIVYCCGLAKHCPYRDQAIVNLGMTKKDYLRFKMMMDKQLRRMLPIAREATSKPKPPRQRAIAIR